ncbi:transporter substrate-binding domain-containing protein [Chitinivorax sp. B]|uniref:substrate-binding periplasmic protein n=1 Tax=Chitinivorax sp. B TaxID=2502235 RepID=UPI0010F71277|nr:transporter substrate-binding domain-containing protein [Chitinivorax sp. B]
MWYLRYTRHWHVVWLALCLLFPVQSIAMLTVIYPQSESTSDPRFEDVQTLLRTALNATTPEFGPYELLPSNQPMNEARYLRELKIGKTVNVVWSSTSVQKERDFLPIRIPLRKSLMGYRIALINQDKQDDLNRIQTVEDLASLTIGQGMGWGDVDLYNANGLKVLTTRYDSLFAMVNIGRVDIFPRGINEIFKEQETFGPQFSKLAIEKHLVIYYPWPYYFFVNRNNPELAKRLETGLRQMILDGTFEQIFQRYHKQSMERANIRQRRIIRLTNPFLPPDTPLQDKTLWNDPER